jgi:hypothetical protein
MQSWLEGGGMTMVNELVTISLVLIILGWLVQLYYSAGKKIFALSFKFVAIYVIACLVLMIDGLEKGNIIFWILNLATAIVALLAGIFAKKARR